MQDPLGTTEMVATNPTFCDPAIDMDDGPEGEPTARQRLVRYRERRDGATLKLRPGVRPNRFVVRPIPAAYVIATLSAMPAGEQSLYAFLAACHEIRLADGNSLKPKGFVDLGDGVRIAERSWADAVRDRFGMLTILEIGAAAYTRACLPEAERPPFVFASG